MAKKNPFKLGVVSVRLVKDAPIYSEQPFTEPYQVVGVLGEQMCQFDREVLCLVNLKTDMTPINVHFASIGSLNSSLVSPRELLKAMVLSNAANVMLVHNHPSSSLLPSKEDTMVTDRMVKICDLMGIPLIDHLIVGGDNRQFFSFREKGLIKNPNIMLSTDYRSLDMKQTLVAEKGKAR